MKKIFNKKFLVGLLFMLALGTFIISDKASSSVSSTQTLTVHVSASANSVKSGEGVTIEWWSEPNADYCETPVGQGGGSGSFSSSDIHAYKNGLTRDTSFSVSCSKDISDDIVAVEPSATPESCSDYTITCFTADTLVIMADGTTKNIQDVKIGDVLKGETTNNKVLGFHQPKLDGKLYSFNDGRYFVTEEHPFKTTNGWKSINPKKTEKENIGITVMELKAGDALITEKGDVLLKTIKSKVGKDDTQLYNFKLDGDHTYYADGYLVHNKAYCPTNCSAGHVANCSGGTTTCYCEVSIGFCNGTITGSKYPLGVNDGLSCSQFNTSTECSQGWLTHGCTWSGSYEPSSSVTTTTTTTETGGGGSTEERLNESGVVADNKSQNTDENAN